MNLLQAFRSPARDSSRSLYPFDSVYFNGIGYPLPMPSQTLGQKEEIIEPGYASLATLAYKANPVVFACMELRRSVFAQARFQWRQVRGGVPGKLFGTQDLMLLEHPWPNATTADLMSRAIQQADLAGNAFVVRRGQRLKLLRPDWVTIVAASEKEPGQGAVAIDAEVVGYAYWPGGKGHSAKPEFLLPEEVAHFAPTPDPMAEFRGMSWVNVVARDIMGDQAATTHKLKFFEQGATPNLVVSLDPAITPDKFKAFVELMKQTTEGVANAYKTMYLGGGADVEVVGANLRQIDFKTTQGAGETRIAGAARCPPVLVGLSEGLQGSSLNTGNYSSARRNFSDTTIADLWSNMSGSLETILPPPVNAELWVDGRNIPFLQEDEKDRAQIQQMDASAISTLVLAGYDPDSVVDAVASGDLNRLVWLGLPSVQLQEPGPDTPAEPPPDAGRALIAQAERRLLDTGLRPTTERIAEALEVSDRTVRRWRQA